MREGEWLRGGNSGREDHSLLLLWPRRREPSEEERLCCVLSGALAVGEAERALHTAEELAAALDRGGLCGRRLLVVCALGERGINLELFRMIDLIRGRGACLAGAVAGFVIDGSAEYYTKALARELARTFNCAGCTLPGKPLAEGTGSLANLDTAARVLGTDLMGAYRSLVKDLAERLRSFELPRTEQAELLCLHASDPDTSNTVALWRLVRKHLPETLRIREISLRNGEVSDCAGCSYETCLDFGRRSACSCGGAIVRDVYPALMQSTALLLLCPNYNDALGAKLTAFINRTTALFRRQPFSDKLLFSIVVSGYSGGDLLENQLIGSLCMNKAFILPPYFALDATANAKGSVLRLPGIEERAELYAQRMAESLGLVHQAQGRRAVIRQYTQERL